jgi:hypothetical protein
VIGLNKRIVVLALAIILSSVGLVAAEEAGIFTINIANNPNSQVITNVSNSTITGQTNYTNSQAAQNITLTNSTMTLNVNGETILISSQNGNLLVSTPEQNIQIQINSNPLPLAPLNISQAPEWLEVKQVGTFNVLNVTASPEVYSFVVAVHDAKYYSAIDKLSTDLSDVFPTAFYYDFGLLPSARFFPGTDYYTIGSGAYVTSDFCLRTPYKPFGIVLVMNPSHQSNTYLPDTFDNSGEQYLAQAIAYYLGEYLQNHA